MTRRTRPRLADIAAAAGVSIATASRTLSQPAIVSQHTRGAVDPNTTATKARRRFPFVAEVQPHHPRTGKAKVDFRPKR